MIAFAVGVGAGVVATAVEVDVGLGGCGVTATLWAGVSWAAGTSVVMGADVGAHPISVATSKAVELQKTGRMALTSGSLRFEWEIHATISSPQELGSYHKDFACQLTAAS